MRIKISLQIIALLAIENSLNPGVSRTKFTRAYDKRVTLEEQLVKSIKSTKTSIEKHTIARRIVFVKNDRSNPLRSLLIESIKIGEEKSSFKIPNPNSSDPPDINSLLFKNKKLVMRKSVNKGEHENNRPNDIRASEDTIVSEDILVSKETLMIENSSSKG